MNSDFIEMVIPSKEEYVGVARLTVSGIASRMGYTYEEIEDIKIAVSEALTNAVYHAYKDQVGLIKLNFVVYKDRLEVIVIDQGQSFDVQTEFDQSGPVDGTTPIDQLDEGGLGLFLIESLMDKVDIRTDAGVVVTMTKLLNRDEVGSNVSRVSSSTQS